MDIALLLRWFLKNKRNFPWRENKTPYAVWVSEVMLQQTQACVVVEYFEKWMALFPSLEDLALADIAKVLKAWEGLGYYSRAKRLHEGALHILKVHQGNIPQDPELLAKVPGVGPYTLGAILSFAFGKKIPAVDGNVVRVMTRLYGIDAYCEKAATKQLIYQKVLELLPEKKPELVSEGLIELGACVCKKKPLCHKCPLKQGCQAFAAGNPHMYPVKQKKTPTEKLFRCINVCLYQNKILVKKPLEDSSLMGHLHQLPFTENNAPLPLCFSLCQKIPFAKEYFTHTFTKYHVKCEPLVYKADKEFFLEGYSWLTRQEIDQCTFSSGDRKILSWIYAKSLL